MTRKPMARLPQLVICFVLGCCTCIFVVVVVVVLCRCVVLLFVLFACVCVCPKKFLPIAQENKYLGIL